MACRDCGQCDIDQGLLNALETLRSLGDEPIIVHRAYSCPEHNAAVGGVKDSQHLEGKASDIEIVGLSLQQMYDRAKQVPEFANGGIGVYDGGFIHVDIRQGRARWSRIKGVYLGISELVAP